MSVKNLPLEVEAEVEAVSVDVKPLTDKILILKTVYPEIATTTETLTSLKFPTEQKALILKAEEIAATVKIYTYTDKSIIETAFSVLKDIEKYRV